ncbi:hypothetical protein TI39_contig308g00011 [Zymoseptoria brevis]|uniref:Zn(2)-C6 fungal-type domain-containing protein n=1 Tax=Zymoseptoria brevis TaxID=1047168 RepID=A0A0F4GTV5_9PEZI|nr:hypothetical protein TI39_contig308g00011 [Zymoseptoria brevis]
MDSFQNPLSCDECRRRRLKCDRRRPKCDRCLPMDADCVYVTASRRRGPKKGQLQALRAQVSELRERLLEHGDPAADVPLHTDDRSEPYESVRGVTLPDDNNVQQGETSGKSTETFSDDFFSDLIDCGSWVVPEPEMNDPETFDVGALSSNSTSAMASSGVPSIDIRVSDATPGQVNLSPSAQADLEELFFARIYPWAPIIHKILYLDRTSQAALSPAQLCLSKAIFTVAAVHSPQYNSLSAQLLHETRQSLNRLKGHDEDLPWSTGTVELAQASLPDARKAFSFVQQCQSQALAASSDTYNGDKHPPVMEPHLDEEQCRSFWLAFALDRYLQGHEGWTCVIPEPTAQDTMLPPFAESIALAALYERCVVHARLAASLVSFDELASKFWARHGWLTNAIDRHVRLQQTQFDNAPTASKSADPLIIFNQVMTQTVILHTGNTLNTQRCTHFFYM